MAKKKKIEEVVEVVPQENPAPVEKESEPITTMRVKAVHAFKDGGLAKPFNDLNYETEWKAGEVRNVPIWLYRACVDSGARLEIL